MIPTPRDLLVAARARKQGAKWALGIVLRARRTNVPVSLAFALVEQESGFTNVFGHDPTIYTGAGEVTKQKYLSYKRLRGPTGRGGMQGVGPCQLTWYSTQDAADLLGGCWKPGCNIEVGLRALAVNIKAHGLRSGIAAYNGSGPAAQTYARQVLAKRDRWHKTLS